VDDAAEFVDGRVFHIAREYTLPVIAVQSDRPYLDAAAQIAGADVSTSLVSLRLTFSSSFRASCEIFRASASCTLVAGSSVARSALITDESDV